MRSGRGPITMLTRAQKLIPEEYFCALLGAFYSAEDCEDFLDEAGTQLDTRFFILDETTLISLGGKAEVPCRVQVGGWPCVMDNALCDEIYICTLATDDGPDSLEQIAAVCFLVGLGVSVHGWFADKLGVHPDEYLPSCDIAGGGIYCLYFSANMSLRKNVKLCYRMAASTDAKNYHIDNGGFSLIIQRDMDQQMLYFSRLAHALIEEGLSAGVAGPFMSASHALSCERIAKAAALPANSGVPLRFMRRSRWLLLAEAAVAGIRMEGYNAYDFLTGAFRRMLDYDAQNNTQYCKSVYEYLVCAKNLKDAAKGLNIHRNTLDNRMIRASELFGIDFTNGRVCYELLFSCKLYYDVIAVNAPQRKWKRMRRANKTNPQGRII